MYDTKSYYQLILSITKCEKLLKWMLLKAETEKEERGTGNGEPEFGNEFKAVICMRSQNGGKWKKTGDYFLTLCCSNSIVGGNIMEGEWKIF